MVNRRNPPRKRTNDNWDFLDVRKSRGYNRLKVKFDRSKCIPLDEEKWLDPTNSPIPPSVTKQFLDNVADLVYPTMEEAGFSPNSSYEKFLTLQLYAAPENNSLSDQTARFCQSAMNFAASKIQGLKNFNIRWTPLVDGATGNTNGYIGSGLYFAQKFYIRDTDNLERKITFENNRPFYTEGGICIVRNDHTYEEPHFSLFIPANETALNLVYSETLPVSVQDARGTPKLVESLTEGLAYHLGLQFCDELQVPNGREHIERCHHMMMKTGIAVYSAVPNSINWIQENGIQNAYDLYMDEPRKFGKAIGIPEFQ